MSLNFSEYNYMLIGIIMTTSIAFSQVTNNSLMDWEVIAKLPDEKGQPNKGLAYSFAGISNYVMLIVGCAFRRFISRNHRRGWKHL